MLTRDQLFAALANANVMAFGRVVRQGETNQTDAAYRERYNGAGGPAYFDSFADHPRILVEIPNDAQGRKSSAAGAYQITRTTWDTVVLPALHAIFGPDAVDFSPPMQDAAFVVLLQVRNALNLVVTGQLEAAIAACHDEWTSLPGAVENHHGWTLEKARELYLQYGGKLQPNTANPGTNVVPATQPAAPIEDKSTPLPAPQPEEKHMPAILASLLPMVLGMFTQRAEATVGKVTGTDPQVAAQFTQSLFGKLGELVGVPVKDDASAVQAVAQLQSRTAAGDTAIVQQLEQHALDYLDKVAPLIDKIAAHDLAIRKAADDSADRAATRGQKDKVDIARLLALSGLGIFAIALLVVGAALLVQLFRDKPVDVLLGSLLTILIYAAARMAEAAYRYRFGGTAESSVVESGNAAVRAAIPKAGA